MVSSVSLTALEPSTSTVPRRMPFSAASSFMRFIEWSTSAARTGFPSANTASSRRVKVHMVASSFADHFVARRGTSSPSSSTRSWSYRQLMANQSDSLNRLPCGSVAIAAPALTAPNARVPPAPPSDAPWPSPVS